MAVFNRLLFSQLKIAMSSWLIITMLVAMARFFIPLDAAFSTLALTLVAFGLYGSVLVPKIYFINGRYLSVFKGTSRNNKTFWIKILSQNCILLTCALFVTFVIVVVSKIKLPDDYLRTLPALLSPPGICSLIVIVFIFMCFMDCNPVFEKMNRGMPDAKTQLKHYFFSTVGVGLLYGWFYMYMEFSPIFALALLSVGVLTAGIFIGDQSVKTLTRANQLKVSMLSLLCVAIIFSCIGFYEYRKSPKSQFLLVSHSDWKFEDIQKVTNAEDWIIWQNQAGSIDKMNTDQLIEMYEKLNQYCPPFRRDTPLRFACHGTPGFRDYQYTGEKLRSEEDVIKLLSSSTEYGQIIGLMYARRLKKPLSKELIVAIERLAEKDGSIQNIARNTMTESYSQDFRYGFELVTIKPE